MGTNHTGPTDAGRGSQKAGPARNAVNPPPTQLPSLTSDLERRAVALLERCDGLVSPIGVTAVPAGPIGFRLGAVAGRPGSTVPASRPGAPGRSEWLVTDAESDPQLDAGRFVLPDHVAAKLRRLAALGVDFDRLFVAHELPPGSLRADVQTLTKDEVAALVPEVPPTARTARALRVATRAASIAVGGVLVPVVVAGMAPLAAAAGIAGSGLDPALIGVTSVSGRAETGELAVWFLIEAWR